MSLEDYITHIYSQLRYMGIRQTYNIFMLTYILGVRGIDKLW